MVSEVHRGVADTHAIVSDIRREMLKSKEEAGSQHRSVRVTRIPSRSVHLVLDRLKTGQRFRPLSGPTSHPCI